MDFVSFGKLYRIQGVEAPFVLRAEEANEEFVGRVRQHFAGKTLRVKIEEVAETAPEADRQRVAVQREMFRKMDALREEMKDIQIPENVNLSKLADEMPDMKF